MRTFAKYNWPSFAWTGVIMYLCLVHSSSLPKIHIPNLDKMVHGTMYMVLVLLMNWGWRRQNTFLWLHNKPVVKIFVAACAYGFSIEVMQELFTTDRHFELLDEAANSFGAAIGSLLAVKMFK